MKKIFLLLLIFVVAVGSAIKASADPPRTSVRVGHFSNITHAQGVLAHGNGFYEQKLGRKIDWKVFNAGPSVIEAIFAGQLDIAYIGPSPAVNGYVKSGGEEVRVVSGAAAGGAALVARSGAGIRSPEDLRGKKVASPQLGNTQDVSLRSWLVKNGLKLKNQGGDVEVLPIANADQLTLFLKSELDAAWTVEPWVSILVEHGQGQIFLDEASLWPDGKYPTTLLIVRKKFLDDNEGLVTKFVAAHAELTEWINRNPDEAKKLINEEIKKETGKEMHPSILDNSFKKIGFSTEILRDAIEKQAEAAFEAGFLKKRPDLSGLFEDSLLAAQASEAGKTVS